MSGTPHILRARRPVDGPLVELWLHALRLASGVRRGFVIDLFPIEYVSATKA